MGVPSVDLLICAYLGQKFRRRSEEGKSYDRQAEDMGLPNKQALLKLANRGTVGLAVLYDLAAVLTEGSLDALAAQAKLWWTNLPEPERSELSEWAEQLGARRARRIASDGAREVTLPKQSRSERVSGADGEERARRAALTARQELHDQAHPGRRSSSRIKRTS